MTEKIPPVNETTEDTNEAISGVENTSFKFPVAQTYEIPLETQKDIESLSAELRFRESPLNEELKEAQAKKDTGGEKEKFETPVVDIREHKSNKWRNFRTAAKFSLAGLFGVTATSALKAETGAGPIDSAKNKIEKTSNVKTTSDSLETAYTGNEAVNDELRQDWNEFQAWLASKDMAGKPELDKGGLGYRLFDEYCKTHETSLNREKLKLIRQEFLKLRAHIIANVRSGKEAFTAGANEENLLRPVVKNEVTGDPDYPGSNFTKFRFPGSKTITLDRSQIDYNKVANNAVNNIDKKMTDVMSKDTKVVKVKDNGFIKAENNRNPIANSDYVKNNTKYNRK